MKINFKYESFPKNYCWSSKSGNNKQRLINNIIKEKKVKIIAEYETKTSIYTTIYLFDDEFGIGFIPLGCEHLKFLEKYKYNIFDGYKKIKCFKILKKQNKKEYEFYITQLIKELILPNTKNKIDELNIEIMTNVEGWLNND